MNWKVRYAAERKYQPFWKSIPPLNISDNWDTTVAPRTKGVSAVGFVGEITKDGGGSTYKRESNGTWTKTLSQESQERYKLTRPGSYKTVDKQGRYTENWENTVFIHPIHREAITAMIQARSTFAHPRPGGGFEYHGYHRVKDLPENYIVSRTNIFDAGADSNMWGTFRIPSHHISPEPFPGAMVLQHGTVTLADGTTLHGKVHYGHDVGTVDY